MEACDYNQASSVGTHVGTYNLELTPKEGYVWQETKDRSTRTFEWSISQASPTLNKQPVLASDFVYDSQDHALVSVEADFNIPNLPVKYAFTKDDFSTPPADADYVDNISLLKANTPGHYYVWFKVEATDDYTSFGPAIVTSSDKSPDSVDGEGAMFWYRTVQGKNIGVYGYCSADSASDVDELIADGEVAGYIPVNKEYTSVQDVPWASKLSDVYMVLFNENMSSWTALTGTKYMSNWFNGASNLIYIVAGDDSFFGDIATSSNVFTGCTSLAGGNGYAYSADKPTDLTLAKFDHNGQNGYITAETGINFLYDYNRGEPQPTELPQMIPAGQKLDVTGVNNYFAEETPV